MEVSQHNTSNLKKVRDKVTQYQLICLYYVFSSFSGLKPNLSKCEVAGIGLLNGIKVAVCGKKCTYLTKDAMKILGIFFFV